MSIEGFKRRVEQKKEDLKEAVKAEFGKKEEPYEDRR